MKAQNKVRSIPHSTSSRRESHFTHRVLVAGGQSASLHVLHNDIGQQSDAEKGSNRAT